MSDFGENAIIVKNAYKHYGRKKNRVDCLVNFNMKVKKGTIYGLLGPSGAGKTTLLSCLVGRKSLNRGDILVFGGKPGSKDLGIPGVRVGYMPQELALFEDFTMNDIVLYFGWIYGMNKSKISERCLFLMNLLNLSSKSKILKNLSGGQRRRVSFVIALLHDPELLILDEPTVGVDPLLRKAIWSHLVDLAHNGNKTIIITTHYIEEARQAHKIGLMRFGAILAEESPDNLLKMYHKSTLEDVFLLLSSEQSENFQSHPSEVIPSEGKSVHGFLNLKRKRLLCEKNARRTMRALIFKNVMRMVRNPGVILFFLALPVIQVILFCLTVGGEPDDLVMAVVNEEEKKPPQGGCYMFNLGERFLRTYDSDASNLIYFADLQSAIATVKDGNAWGVFHIPKSYSESLGKMAAGGIPSKDVIKTGQIYVRLDSSNQQISFILTTYILNAFEKYIKKIIHDCAFGENIGNLLLSFEKPIYGTDHPSFRDFVAPGVILTIVFFLSVGQTAISLISEQKEGMLDRTLVAGVKPVEILAGHVIVQFIILLCQSGLALFFVFYVFGVHCEGGFVSTTSLTLLVGVCGMCYGYLISAACDNEITAIQISLGSFYPCLLLSGIIWPIEGMPFALRLLSKLSPLTYGTVALRSIMSRGWSIDKFDVFMGYAMTCAWITLYLILSVTILQVKRG